MIQLDAFTRRSPKLSTILLATLALLLLFSTAHAAPPPKHAPITIGYQPGDHSTQLVTVHLNDNTTALFLLSTGTDASGISSSLAARLKLHQSKVKLGDGTNLKDPYGEDRKQVRIHKLQIGGLTLSGINLVVPKLDVLSTMVGKKVDGIIGSDILKTYAVLFDFQQQRITLWAGGNLSLAQRKQYGLEKAHSVAIEKLVEGLGFFVEVRLNGKTDDLLLVETGAAGTVISSEVASELHLTSLGDIYADSVFGPLNTHPATVTKFAVGDSSVSPMTIRYEAVKGNPVPPTLGLDFMLQYHVLMDFPQERMYFAPVERRIIVVPFSDKKVLSIPLFDVLLTDGKVHVLGLNAGDDSLLDKTVGASLSGLYKMPSQSPAIVSEMVTSRLIMPTTNTLIGERDFSLTPWDDIRQSIPLLEGIIGFEQCALQMDFTARRVSIISPGNVGATTLVSKSAVRIPLIHIDQGYKISGLVDGKPATFTLNLIANTSLLNSNKLGRSLKPQAANEYVGKVEKVRFIRLHQIQVGAVLWNDPVVSDDMEPGSDLPNSLGIDFLKRFHATIDFAGQVLYLDPDPDYKASPVFELTTGIVETVAADGRMFVLMVLNSSSAKAANVQVDDELLEVNGKTVNKTSVEEIHAELTKPIGTIVTILLLHKGDAKPRTVKLTVRDTL